MCFEHESFPEHEQDFITTRPRDPLTGSGSGSGLIVFYGGLSLVGLMIFSVLWGWWITKRMAEGEVKVVSMIIVVTQA